MKTKTKVVTTYLLTDWLKIVLPIFLVMLMIGFFDELLQMENWQMLVQKTFDFSSSVFISMGVIIFGLGNYQKFEYLIQNGISRQTFFKAKMLATSIIVVGLTLIDYVNTYLIQKNAGVVVTDFYTKFYGHFFAVSWLNYGAKFIFDGLSLFILLSFLMLICLGLSLCKKTARLIIIAAFITCPFLILGLGIDLLVKFIDHQTLVSTANDVQIFFKKIFMFVTGYSKNIPAGHYNPTIYFIILILLSIIGIGLSYFVMQHLKLRTE